MKNRSHQEARAAPANPGYATAGVPLTSGPVVSEIIPVPVLLHAWLEGPLFQPVLLKVKEQTGINYFTLNKDANDGAIQLWIYSPTPERARMARLLVDVNFKQQLKLLQAEEHLRQMQMDLSSAQNEIVSGLRVEFRAPSELIGLMIGKGGARIQEIIKTTGVKTINMENTGKVTIVGTDAENAQRARLLFELFEDSSLISEDDAEYIVRDFSMLNDLKMSSNLLVVKLEREPHRLVYIGSQEAISCAKIVLATQLDYLRKRVQLLSDERQIRSELQTFRRAGDGGRGGGGGGRGARDGGDSLGRLGGRGTPNKESYASSSARAKAVTSASSSPPPASAEKKQARGGSILDSMQQVVGTNGNDKAKSSAVRLSTAPPASAEKAPKKQSKQAASPATEIAITVSAAVPPEPVKKEVKGKGKKPAVVKAAESVAVVEAVTTPAPASAPTPAKKGKGSAKTAASEETNVIADAPVVAPKSAKKASAKAAPAPAAEPTPEPIPEAGASKSRRRGRNADTDADTQAAQDSLITAFNDLAVAPPDANKPKPAAKGKKPPASAPSAVESSDKTDPLPKRVARATRSSTKPSESSENA